MRRMIYPLRSQSHKVITDTSLSVKLSTGRDERLHSLLEETFVLCELLFPSLIMQAALEHTMRTRSDCFNLYLVAFEDVIRFLT